MSDLSKFALIVLEPPEGLEFRPTGRFLFPPGTSLQRAQEVWRDHPQWGFQSHSSCTATGEGST